MRKIRSSCRIAGNIMNRLIAKLPVFKSEGEIKRFLKVETVQQGCTLAFEPIVASGKAAGIPHYRREKELEHGFLIVDFGVKYQGYCSDISRTFYKGKPSKRDEVRYALVRRCQEEAIGRIMEYRERQLEGRKVYLLARKLLGKHKKLFTHGLGHGFGIEIHEYPSLGKVKGQVLKEGMVVTVEPGIYAGFGIRIEDDLFLGKKVEVLTSHVPKGLICF
jgi:Xaa-Pro aminopeptidase